MTHTLNGADGMFQEVLAVFVCLTDTAALSPVRMRMAPLTGPVRPCR
jgi:hypothetical protein